MKSASVLLGYTPRPTGVRDELPRSLRHVPRTVRHSLRTVFASFPVGSAIDCVGRRFGKDEFIAELGRGGMGIVFKADQTDLHRAVAVKMILGGTVAGPEDLRRFRIEAEATAGLHHPNIIRIYELGEVDGCPFFSMEYIEGYVARDPLNCYPEDQATPELPQRHCGLRQRQPSPGFDMPI
jgi:Protein kinase domain